MCRIKRPLTKQKRNMESRRDDIATAIIVVAILTFFTVSSILAGG